MEPQVEARAEQPYVGVRGVVTMRTIGHVADRIPEIFGWLGVHGIEPAGAPFLKYNVIDLERELEIEAGVPVAATPDATDGDLFSGVLPAGRYVTLTHVGHPDRLIELSAMVLDWAAKQGLKWDMSDTDRGERWRCRIASFKTDPRIEPDLNKWETELAFLLAD